MSNFGAAYREAYDTQRRIIEAQKKEGCTHGQLASLARSYVGLEMLRRQIRAGTMWGSLKGKRARAAAKAVGKVTPKIRPADLSPVVDPGPAAGVSPALNASTVANTGEPGKLRSDAEIFEVNTAQSDNQVQGAKPDSAQEPTT